MRIIRPIGQLPHHCREHLPATKGGYGPTEEPEGTLAVCDCGRIWVVDLEWTGEMREPFWRPLYWTERKLRRRVRAACICRSIPHIDCVTHGILVGKAGNGGRLEE